MGNLFTSIVAGFIVSLVVNAVTEHKIAQRCLTQNQFKVSNVVYSCKLKENSNVSN